MLTRLSTTSLSTEMYSLLRVIPYLCDRPSWDITRELPKSWTNTVIWIILVVPGRRPFALRTIALVILALPASAFRAYCPRLCHFGTFNLIPPPAIHCL